MKRWKWAAYGAGGLVLLVGAAAVAVRVFLPPAKVKALALQKLGAALGREVRLADASVQLSGVRLSGLEVSEVPDFKAGKAFKAKSVTATPRWWPLLTRREVLVGALAVDSPEVWVSPAPAAKAAPKASAPAPARNPSGAAFSVSSLSVKGGALTYTDPKGVSASLKGLALEAKDVRLDGPVPFSLGFDYSLRSGGAAHAGRVELQGSLDAGGGDPAKGALTLEPLSATFDGLKARATGKVSGFLAPNIEAELTLPRVEGVLPAGSALPSLSGPLKARMNETGLTVETLALKGEGAALSLKAAQDKTKWRVSSLSAAWGAVRLAASGTADTGAKGGTTVDFKAKLEPLALSEAAKLVPGGAAYEAGGTFAADLSAKGPAAAPALTGEVTLKDAALTLSKQRLDGVDGKLTLSADSAAGTLKGKLNGSGFEAKLDGQDLRKAPRVRVDAKLDKLDLSTLPAAEGKGREDAKASGGTAPAPAKP
ncbi:hypothetical protein EPO15_10030, partial [bacterium]